MAPDKKPEHGKQHNTPNDKGKHTEPAKKPAVAGQTAKPSSGAPKR